jgi:hypothetical protein
MGDLPKVDDLTPEQQRELAEAYLDLLSTMNGALEACETGYGFFSWNGRGYEITGHPPHGLVEQLTKAVEGT